MFHLSSADSFSKSTFSKNYFRNTIRVSSSLDLDQAQQFWPDLGPNCLQRYLQTALVGKELKSHQKLAADIFIQILSVL